MTEKTPTPRRKATIRVEPDGRPAADAPGRLRLLGRYLRSRAFLFTLLGLAVAAAVAFLLVDWGLDSYTRHGQRLEVGEYTRLDVDQARRAIEGDDFRVEVIDSVFLVDEPPRTVLRQDPPAGAFVKENRRIYLTVTKAVPDQVTLPALAGTYDLDRYLRKLALLDLTGVVREERYSSRYQPNTILEVYYDGREVSEIELRNGFRVPRGSALAFVVSSSSGGRASLPNLKCQTFDAAAFLLESSRLSVGTVTEDATVTDRATAYVWRQDPAPSPGQTVGFDSEVALYLTQDIPADCDAL